MLASISNDDCIFLRLYLQKLAGASLLVLANKQDLPGALTVEQVAKGMLSGVYEP